ncbi:hypothetical protein GCM10023088_78530 [Actinomadura verrucosospora]|uniref:hypothetical protein n=1 Tax=Actinomadura verrucosospora TaxID=46165 RepID=UPI0031ECD0B0
MPRLLRSPPLTVLPHGPVRNFVELLFDYREIANYPKLKEISEQVKSLPESEQNGTASRETIRRMFHGSVPSEWHTVEVVFLALCRMADVDPDRRVKYTYWDEEEESNVEVDTDRRSQMREVWSAALYGRSVSRVRFQGIDFDHEDPEPPRRSTGFRAATDDPWATGRGGFSDDPPF